MPDSAPFPLFQGTYGSLFLLAVPYLRMEDGEGGQALIPLADFFAFLVHCLGPTGSPAPIVFSSLEAFIDHLASLPRSPTFPLSEADL
jgi:hypothetical protein